MARDQIDMTPLQSRDELVAWLAAGVKPPSEFRIGTEHEKTPFTLEGHHPVPYEGARGIGALLEGMQLLLGWEPIMERGNIIGLYDVTGGGAISLEPGGQFELSGAPVETVHQTQSELMAHLAQVREIATPLGIGFLGLGMTPSWSRGQIPVMPKGRYKIMTNYMPKVGQYGLDMMYRTCTVQTNLDFSSEADMVKKLRVSVALQPIATAVVRQLPVHRRPAQRFSVVPLRDLARHRQRAFGHDPLGVRGRYGVRALGRLCARRSHVFRQARRQLHRRVRLLVPRLLRRQEPGLPRRAADAVGLGQSSLDDFPGSPPQALPRNARRRWRAVGPSAGLPAFWVGLLYDDVTLDAAWDLVKHWTAVERQALRDDVPRFGFKARIRDRYLFEIARECLKLSHAGLRRRNRVDHSGRDESRHLEPLERILESGRTPAEEMLEKFNGAWGGAVEPAYTEYAF